MLQSQPGHFISSFWTWNWPPIVRWGVAFSSTVYNQKLFIMSGVLTQILVRKKRMDNSPNCGYGLSAGGKNGQTCAKYTSGTHEMEGRARRTARGARKSYSSYRYLFLAPSMLAAWLVVCVWILWVPLGCLRILCTRLCAAFARGQYMHFIFD